MEDLMKLIGELGNALHQISPPEIQKDIEDAFEEYKNSNK